MKALWNSPYRNFFLLSLCCNIIASWFSIGYHQIDEHFMILEFSNYKFGTVPQRVVPWEFTGKLRPTLQPTFAYCCFRFFQQIGIANAFVQVFLLRLFSALVAWYVSCTMALRLAPDLKYERPKHWWIISLACLWFMPYLNVRFSSENFAGITFLAALLCVPDISRGLVPIRANTLRWMACGLLLSLSFYFRFQMAFAILGLLFWLLLYARPAWKVYACLLAGAIAGLSFNLLVDHWFYDTWVLTPYRYYEANILQDAASDYGISPWYDYIVLFVTQGIPPISWVLLLLFIIGLLRRPKQLMVFVFLPFLLGHMLVPHKEFRFLYPMVVPFLFICFTGLDDLWPKMADRKWLKPVLKTLVVVNMLLLAYRIVWPAKTNHLYYKFLNEYAAGKPVHLLTLGRGIYDEGYNEIYLYRPKDFSEDTMPDVRFRPYMQQQQEDSILVMSYQAVLPYNDPRYTAERLYVYLPDWIMNIQLNDWQSRSDIWSIWLLRRKKD